MKWLAATALSVSVLGGFFMQPALADIPASERQFLLDLYDSTGGDNWHRNDHWGDAEGTECSWIGVTCDMDKEHVVELNLISNNLVGSLPQTLNNLRSEERRVGKEGRYRGWAVHEKEKEEAYERNEEVT